MLEYLDSVITKASLFSVSLHSSSDACFDAFLFSQIKEKMLSVIQVRLSSLLKSNLRMDGMLTCESTVFMISISQSPIALDWMHSKNTCFWSEGSPGEQENLHDGDIEPRIEDTLSSQGSRLWMILKEMVAADH